MNSRSNTKLSTWPESANKRKRRKKRVDFSKISSVHRTLDRREKQLPNSHPRTPNSHVIHVRILTKKKVRKLHIPRKNRYPKCLPPKRRSKFSKTRKKQSHQKLPWHFPAAAWRQRPPHWWRVAEGAWRGTWKSLQSITERFGTLPEKWHQWNIVIFFFGSFSMGHVCLPFILRDSFQLVTVRVRQTAHLKGILEMESFHLE